jgi:hypothetical protein
MQSAWFDGPTIPASTGDSFLHAGSPLECCKACFEEASCRCASQPAEQRASSAGLHGGLGLVSQEKRDSRGLNALAMHPAYVGYASGCQEEIEWLEGLA